MAFHDPLRAGGPSGSPVAGVSPLLPSGLDAAGNFTAEAEFTALEWRVIGLASDELPVTPTAAARGLWARLLARFSTTPPPRPLAGERLEALRRLASDYWHGRDPVGSGNMALFRAAGFSEGHLALLLGFIRPAGLPA